MTEEEIKNYINKNTIRKSDEKILTENVYNEFVLRDDIADNDINLFFEIITKENINIEDNKSTDDSTMIDVRNQKEISGFNIYLNEIGKYSLLTPEEEYNLFIRAKNDDNVKKELLHRNLRLVVSIALKNKLPGLSLEDKIQEGNIGLMKAINKFDPTKGYKFSTYATWWIKQSITRAIEDQSTTIRKPVHYQEKLRKIKKCVDEYKKRENTMPSYDDISKLTGFSVSYIKLILSLEQDYVSLEAPVGTDGDSKLEDFIADDTNNYIHDIENKELKNIIINELKDIFTMDYNLEEDEINALTEFGKVVGSIRKEYKKKQYDIKQLNEESKFYGKAFFELSNLKNSINNKLCVLHSDCRNNKIDYYICIKKEKEYRQEIEEINLIIKNFSDYLIENRTIYNGDIAIIFKKLKKNEAIYYDEYINKITEINTKYLEKIKMLEKNTNVCEINNKINNFQKIKIIKQYLQNMEEDYFSIIRTILKDAYVDISIINYALNLIRKNCRLNNEENINCIISGVNVHSIEKKWMEQLVLILQTKNIMSLNQVTKVVRYYNMKQKKEDLLLDDVNLSYIDNYWKHNVLLNNLREKDILEKRYGIKSEVYTLEAIASEYGLTRERVRQIVMKATDKLKKDLNSKKIYIDCSNTIETYNSLKNY